jgi:hypothetical protein
MASSAERVPVLQEGTTRRVPRAGTPPRERRQPRPPSLHPPPPLPASVGKVRDERGASSFASSLPPPLAKTRQRPTGQRDKVERQRVATQQHARIGDGVSNAAVSEHGGGRQWGQWSAQAAVAGCVTGASSSHHHRTLPAAAVL